jgi:hypothetical protein
VGSGDGDGYPRTWGAGWWCRAAFFAAVHKGACAQVTCSWRFGATEALRSRLFLRLQKMAPHRRNLTLSCRSIYLI